MEGKSPRGRHREAAENDVRILDAARAVFTDDPEAPISAVGARAGVGKSALYRRYASKEALLQAVGEEVTETYVALIERSHQDLDDGVAPPDVLAAFLADAASTGTHTLVLAISGRFAPSPRDQRRSAEGWEAGDRLVTRLHDAGALRAEVDWLDLNKLLETLGGLRAPEPARAHQLRRRYAALLTAGLAPASAPLPDSPAGPSDFGRAPAV